MKDCKRNSNRILILILGMLICLFIEIGYRSWGFLVHCSKSQSYTPLPTPINLETISNPTGKIPHKISSTCVSNATKETILYQTNSKGFRDAERNYQKTPGKFRILLLGASRSFGIGINQQDRFSEFIERNAQNVEVINMGVVNFCIKQEEILFLEEGIKYNPDLVLNEVTHGAEDVRVLWSPCPAVNYWRMWLRSRSIIFKTLEKMYLAIDFMQGKEIKDVESFSKNVRRRNIPYVLITTRKDIWKGLEKRKSGIPIIKLGPENWCDRQYSIEGIGHINKEGNKVLGGIILKFLMEKNMIPNMRQRANIHEVSMMQ